MDMLKKESATTRLRLCLIVFVSLAVFAPALGHDFLSNWDDNLYVVNNPGVHGLTFEHVREAFAGYFLGNYAPLHLISYMLDYEVWGLRPFGFILTNLLLHTANGLLFYLLLRRLAGERPWVLLASLLFLLHPVQVESVVWISQRKNLLSMTFFLGAFLCYHGYRDAAAARRRMLYSGALVLFVLALLTKSVAVILPVVLVLYELCYRPGCTLKGVLLDKAPFVACAAVVSLLALSSHSAEAQGGVVGFHGGSPLATFLTMLPVLASYLGMLLWPAGLSAHYDPVVRQGVDLQVTAAGLLVLSLMALGIWLYRTRRDRFFWYALFFVGLIPVSQIVPLVTLMNDRYLYYPMLGAGAFLSMTLQGDLRWDEATQVNQARVRAAVALTVLAACALLTLQRANVWRNGVTLWQDVVRKYPSTAMPRLALGEALLRQGRFDEAITEYRAGLAPGIKLGRALDAAQAAETFAGAHGNLGNAYAAKGMLPEAIAEYTLALSGYRTLADAGAGRVGEKLALPATVAALHCDLGVALARQGNLDQAVAQFRTAVTLFPALDSAHFNLGNALAQSGRLQEAIASFETALALKPGHPAYLATLERARGELARQTLPGGAR